MVNQIEQLQNILIENQPVGKIITPKIRQMSSIFDLKDPEQSK